MNTNFGEQILRAIVHDALRTAQEENRYDIQSWAVDEICVDLATCCPPLDGKPVEVLRPHVQSWLEARRAA